MLVWCYGVMVLYVFLGDGIAVRLGGGLRGCDQRGKGVGGR